MKIKIIYEIIHNKVHNLFIIKCKILNKYKLLKK